MYQHSSKIPLVLTLFRMFIKQIALALYHYPTTETIRSSRRRLHKLPTYRQPSVCVQVTSYYVAAQIRLHIQRNNIGDPFQSAYRPSHSVETAIVCIQDDVIRSLDARKHVVLVLLDLSAAFDTINHAILLTELHRIGVQDDAHRWIESYLTDRTQCVTVNDHLSSVMRPKHGVPQGSGWALSFSRCTALDFRMYSSSTGSVIMFMRMTPSYTLISLAMMLRSLSTEYAGVLLT